MGVPSSPWRDALLSGPTAHFGAGSEAEATRPDGACAPPAAGLAPRWRLRPEVGSPGSPPIQDSGGQRKTALDLPAPACTPLYGNLVLMGRQTGRGGEGPEGLLRAGSVLRPEGTAQLQTWGLSRSQAGRPQGAVQAAPRAQQTPWTAKAWVRCSPDPCFPGALADLADSGADRHARRAPPDGWHLRQGPLESSPPERQTCQ